MFIWYALNCAQWCCFLDTFSIKWNWEIVDCRSRHILLFATWLLIELPRRVGRCHKVEALMDILNILIICYWLNFDTQDSMICLSNYLLRLCLTPSLVIFFEWAITFLSQRLLVTRHRSLFMKRSAPHFLLGSRKYIGLVSDLRVGFSYKPSLNSFFVYDFVLAIDCNQLLLIERFSYDLENARTKRKHQTKRSWFDPFIHWLIKQITNTYLTIFQGHTKIALL